MSQRETDNIVRRLNRRVPFSYNYHNDLPEKMPGLYSFWVRGCCLYVGMAMNIKRRLSEHDKFDKNPDLAEYFSVFVNEMEVSSVPIPDADREILLMLEQQVTCAMNPKTNKTNVKRCSHNKRYISENSA